MRIRVLAAPLALTLCVLAAADRPRRPKPPKTPFSADDILKVVTPTVLDLSDNGKRVAVALRRLFDNADTDNYRAGDPTYVPPSRVQLLVIDTTTGAKQTVFKDLVNVRQAAWSHDGQRLAILVVDNPDAPAPVPATGKPTKGKEKERQPEQPPDMGRGMGGGRGRGGAPMDPRLEELMRRGPEGRSRASTCGTPRRRC